MCAQVLSGAFIAFRHGVNGCLEKLWKIRIHDPRIPDKAIDLN
jgi:hypothetical protein